MNASVVSHHGNAIKAAWSVDVPDNIGLSSNGVNVKPVISPSTLSKDISKSIKAPKKDVSNSSQRRNIFKSWKHKKSKQNDSMYNDVNNDVSASETGQQRTDDCATSIRTFDEDSFDRSPKKPGVPKLAFDQESNDNLRGTVGLSKNNQDKLRRSPSTSSTRFRKHSTMSKSAQDGDEQLPVKEDSNDNKPEPFAKSAFKRALFKLSIMNKFSKAGGKSKLDSTISKTDSKSECSLASSQSVDESAAEIMDEESTEGEPAQCERSPRGQPLEFEHVSLVSSATGWVVGEDKDSEEVSLRDIKKLNFFDRFKSKPERVKNLKSVPTDRGKSKFSRAVLMIKTANKFKSNLQRKSFSTSDINDSSPESNRSCSPSESLNSITEGEHAQIKVCLDESDITSASVTQSPSQTTRGNITANKTDDNESSRRNSLSQNFSLLSKLKHDSIDYAMSDDEKNTPKTKKRFGGLGKILAVVRLKSISSRSTEVINNEEIDTAEEKAALSRKSSIPSQTGSLKSKPSFVSRMKLKRNSSKSKSNCELSGNMEPLSPSSKSIRRNSISPSPSPNASRRNSTGAGCLDVTPSELVKVQSVERSPRAKKTTAKKSAKVKSKLKKLFSKINKTKTNSESNLTEVLTSEPNQCDNDSKSVQCLDTGQSHLDRSVSMPKFNETLASALENIGTGNGDSNSLPDVAHGIEPNSPADDDYDLPVIKKPIRMYDTSSESSGSSWALTPLPDNKDVTGREEPVTKTNGKQTKEKTDKVDCDETETKRKSTLDRNVIPVSNGNESQNGLVFSLETVKQTSISRQEMEFEQIQKEEQLDSSRDCKISELESVIKTDDEDDTSNKQFETTQKKTRNAFMKLFAITAFKRKKKKTELQTTSGEVDDQLSGVQSSVVNESDDVSVPGYGLECDSTEGKTGNEAEEDTRVNQLTDSHLTAQPSMFADVDDLDEEPESVDGEYSPQPIHQEDEDVPERVEQSKPSSPVQSNHSNEKEQEKQKKHIFPTLFSIVKWKKKLKKAEKNADRNLEPSTGESSREPAGVANDDQTPVSCDTGLTHQLEEVKIDKANFDDLPGKQSVDFASTSLGSNSVSIAAIEKLKMSKKEQHPSPINSLPECHKCPENHGCHMCER